MPTGRGPRRTRPRPDRVAPDVARLFRRLARTPRLFAAALTSLLIVATFPDVLFAGTSLRLSDQLWGSYQNLELFRVHPLISTSVASLGAAYGDWIVPYNDIGGATWQSEPMMEFMRNSLWTLDSPYWNPYSSAGALGPETLVDLKFSAFTIAYAVLGGGTPVYNAVLLAFFWLGTYFVVRIAREKLQVSAFGCAAAGVFYLLNGYSAGNVGSNVALSYTLIPVCLYASWSFLDRYTLRGFACLSLALAALMTFTFLPTTIAAVIAIMGCAVGYGLAQGRRLDVTRRTVVSMLLLHALAGAAAFALLAVIYLPFLESLSITGILDHYASRIFYPASLVSALSLFTPSHFFRSSWLHMEPEAARLAGNTIYHLGVLGLVVSACSFRTRISRFHPLAWTCLVLIAATSGRIFGVPGVSDVIGLVPVIRSFGAQYLWVGVVIPMTLLVAIGADNLRQGVSVRVPTLAIVGAGVASAVLLALTYGLKEPEVRGKVIALGTALALGVVGTAAVWIAPRASVAQRRFIAGVVVVLLFVELALDARWLRYEANDVFSNPTSEVPFLQSHVGDYRTMTLGAYATTLDRGGAYRLQEVTSLNVGTLPGYRDYFNDMTRALPQVYRMGDFVSLGYPQDAQDLSFYDWRLVDLLGVKYIIVPRTSVEYLGAFERNQFHRVHDSPFTVVFENPGVLPRAFAVDVVRNGEEPILPSALKDNVTPAKITRYRNSQVVIAGTSDRPSLVVLTDNWHPNWRALLNGAPVPIERVNGTFRGVWVPGGEFRIEMSYQPRTLSIAIVSSGLTLLMLLVMCFAPRRVRSSSRKPPADIETPIDASRVVQ